MFNPRRQCTLKAKKDRLPCLMPMLTHSLKPQVTYLFPANHITSTLSCPRLLTQSIRVQPPPQLDQKTVYSQVQTKNAPTIIPGQLPIQEHVSSTESIDDAVRRHHEFEEVQGATGERESVAPSYHGSVAPTTMSNVKRLVEVSRYHDETLCQLLDAARLNLIGEEAKKALQRAARARVTELRELREAGEIEVGSLDPTVVLASHAERSPKRGGRRKSKEKGRTVSGKSAKSAKSEKSAMKQEPPPWVQDVSGCLSIA